MQEVQADKVQLPQLGNKLMQSGHFLDISS